MPHITREGSRYFISYITGPSHVGLGLSFAEVETNYVLVKRATQTDHTHGELDKEEIRRAVLAGVERALNQSSIKLYLAEIIYYGGDTPNYALYEYCAEKLSEHALNNVILGSN